MRIIGGKEAVDMSTRCFFLGGRGVSV